MISSNAAAFSGRLKPTASLYSAANLGRITSVCCTLSLIRTLDSSDIDPNSPTYPKSAVICSISFLERELARIS